METEAGEPERRIGTVVMQRDAKGRLGVKIGGAPSGVYVDKIDWDVATVVDGSLQVLIEIEPSGYRERCDNFISGGRSGDWRGPAKSRVTRLRSCS